MARTSNVRSLFRRRDSVTGTLVALLGVGAGLAAILLPRFALQAQVGLCWKNGQFVDFVWVDDHLCDPSRDGCPDPYDKCSRVVAPQGCPVNCLYRKTQQHARGYYCVPSDEPDAACFQCAGDFICDEYHIFTDKDCSQYCQSDQMRCKRSWRLEEGLCKMVPPP